MFAGRHASKTTESAKPSSTSSGRRYMTGQQISDVSKSKDPFFNIPRLKRQPDDQKKMTLESLR